MLMIRFYALVTYHNILLHVESLLKHQVMCRVVLSLLCAKDGSHPGAN